MSHQWIFSNSRITYDKWEVGGDAVFGNPPQQWRRRQYYVERYIKAVPPISAVKFDIGYQASFEEVECFANGVEVDLERVSGVDYPILELIERVSSFDPSSAGVVMITESWQMVPPPAERFDPETGGWVPEDEIEEDI